MVDGALNFQTQAAAQTMQAFINDEQTVSATQTGKLDNQTVQIETGEVDPSTKDDECMSSFMAQKQTKKAQHKKGLRNSRKPLNGVRETADSKKVNEQDARSKRISKQTEARLTSIQNMTQKDLQSTIQERSNALFSGSEEKYEKCFQKLEELSLKKQCTEATVKDTLKAFDDVAEQHNALQIVRDVWERKLANLKKFADERPSDSSKEPESDAEQQQIQQQIRSLETQIGELDKVRTQLLNKHGDRIMDSYQLAPLLREVTAHFTHDVTLPPKDFNALILDKLLPLKGNPLQTFTLLTQNLIDGFNDTRSAFAHFSDNLSVVTRCLTAELRSCPDPSIASAIVNACRTTEKLGTIQDLNVQLMQKAVQTFPHLA